MISFYTSSPDTYLVRLKLHLILKRMRCTIQMVVFKSMQPLCHKCMEKEALGYDNVASTCKMRKLLAAVDDSILAYVAD